jgi:glycosyltransferase involved in cell wall biosynthesis
MASQYDQWSGKSMMGPLVSVVIAVRDSENFVESAVRSALAQTYAPLEIVVVDDGSADGTSEIIARIHDARLRVLRTAGIGSAAARNAGIRATSGPYLAFLDADDLWDRKKIATHVRALQSSPEADLTFSRSRLIDENGANLRLPVRRARGSYDFESLLRDNVIGNGSAVVVRRSAIPEGGFDEARTACIDYDLWLRIALARAGNVRCIPEALTSYRRHPAQVSADWRRMKTGWDSLMLKMRELAPEATARAEPAARANWCRYLSFVAHERGERREALGLLMQSFRASPEVAVFNLRTWLLAGSIATHVVLPSGISAATYSLGSVSRKVL